MLGWCSYNDVNTPRPNPFWKLCQIEEESNEHKSPHHEHIGKQVNLHRTVWIQLPCLGEGRGGSRMVGNSHYIRRRETHKVYPMKAPDEPHTAHQEEAIKANISRLGQQDNREACKRKYQRCA